MSDQCGPADAGCPTTLKKTGRQNCVGARRKKICVHSTIREFGNRDPGLGIVGYSRFGSTKETTCLPRKRAVPANQAAAGTEKRRLNRWNAPCAARKRVPSVREKAGKAAR